MSVHTGRELLTVFTHARPSLSLAILVCAVMILGGYVWSRALYLRKSVR